MAAGSASLADALDFLADVANYAVSLLIVGMAWRYLLEGVAAGWARASIQSQSALVPGDHIAADGKIIDGESATCPAWSRSAPCVPPLLTGASWAELPIAALDQEGNVIAVVAPRRLLDSAKEPMEPPRQRKRSAPCRP